MRFMVYNIGASVNRGLAVAENRPGFFQEWFNAFIPC